MVIIGSQTRLHFNTNIPDFAETWKGRRVGDQHMSPQTRAAFRKLSAAPWRSTVAFPFGRRLWVFIHREIGFNWKYLAVIQWWSTLLLNGLFGQTSNPQQINGWKRSTSALMASQTTLTFRTVWFLHLSQSIVANVSLDVQLELAHQFLHVSHFWRKRLERLLCVSVLPPCGSCCTSVFLFVCC